MNLKENNTEVRQISHLAYSIDFRRKPKDVLAPLRAAQWRIRETL